MGEQVAAGFKLKQDKSLLRVYLENFIQRKLLIAINN